MSTTFSIKEVRDSKEKKSKGDGGHEGYGPYWVTARDTFVYSNNDDKTVCVSADSNETQWTADGVVLAAWPDNSAFLMTSGARTTNTRKWPLKAVDQMGTTLWEQEVRLESPISMWITQTYPVNNSPPFLIIGTAQKGRAITFPMANRPAGISRSCLLVGKDATYVLFAASAFSGQIVGRFSFRVNEIDRSWFYAKLPNHKEAPKIPDELFVGEAFEFQPDVPATDSLYSLKSGPQGMVCDPKTARIQWQPDLASLGMYDVEIVKTEHEKETSVLKFAFRVKSKRP
jgi:hypothetical protein